MHILKMLHLIEASWVIQRFNMSVKLIIDMLLPKVTEHSRATILFTIRSLSLVAIIAAIVMMFTVLNVSAITLAIASMFLILLFVEQVKTLKVDSPNQAVTSNGEPNAFLPGRDIDLTHAISLSETHKIDEGKANERRSAVKQTAIEMLHKANMAKKPSEAVAPIMSLLALGIYAVDNKIMSQKDIIALLPQGAGMSPST